MIFQRFGSPRTQIHKWTMATNPKNTTQSDRKAASLSRRIANNLYIAESETLQVFFFQGAKIQKQEKIRSAKLPVQCRRPAYDCANPQIAFNETRQLLK